MSGDKDAAEFVLPGPSGGRSHAQRWLCVVLCCGGKMQQLRGRPAPRSSPRLTRTAAEPKPDGLAELRRRDLQSQREERETAVRVRRLCFRRGHEDRGDEEAKSLGDDNTRIEETRT